jgi:hypothetical protein
MLYNDPESELTYVPQAHSRVHQSFAPDFVVLFYIAEIPLVLLEPIVSLALLLLPLRLML